MLAIGLASASLDPQSSRRAARERFFRGADVHYMLTQRAGETVTSLDDIIANMDDEAIRKSSDLVREALSTLEMDPMFVITLFRPDGNAVVELAAGAFARL